MLKRYLVFLVTYTIFLSGCYIKSMDIFANVPIVVFKTPESLFSEYVNVASNKQISKKNFTKRYLALWYKEALLYNYNFGVKYKTEKQAYKTIQHNISMLVDSVYKSSPANLKITEISSFKPKPSETFEKFKNSLGKYSSYHFIALENGKAITYIHFVQDGYLLPKCIELIYDDDMGYRIIDEYVVENYDNGM
ncbi:hypothetical protein NO1_0200 [Candidatus Termititenax aidoneus]|uniref:Lipoprotein n=1 Tax=Termititenax aidoneus TaxID=2218524 RepID=A0A388T9H0_TERA1|nr:hypothetical protein NO1_0200 [Candidatus Termititenax aidoneus]